MFSFRRLPATFKAFCDKEMSVTGIKSGQLDSFETCSGGRNVFTMLAFEKKVLTSKMMLTNWGTAAQQC